MPESPENPSTARMQPTAMTTADAARILAALGRWPVSEAMLAQDIEAGAPANADGTLNLVHYAAWRVRRLAEGNRSGD